MRGRAEAALLVRRWLIAFRREAMPWIRIARTRRDSAARRNGRRDDALRGVRIDRAETRDVVRRERAKCRAARLVAREHRRLRIDRMREPEKVSGFVRDDAFQIE